MKKNLLVQLVVGLTLLSGCVPQKSRQDENPPREVSLVVSPFLPGDPQAQALQLVAWAIRQANCRFRVYNGWDGLEVTAFTSPHMDYYKEDAAIRRIGAPLQKWMAWSREHSSNTNLAGSGAVSIPKVLALLAQEHSSPENLIIIGSPVARFPNATNYDFALPFFRLPGDGQITGDKTSPFFSPPMDRSLAGTKVFFFYPHIDANAWPLGYERKLHHFFGLFFASRAGNLVAFTPDLDAGLKLLNSSSKVPLTDFKIETAGIVGMLDARETPGSVIGTKAPQLPPAPTPIGTNTSQALTSVNHASTTVPRAAVTPTTRHIVTTTQVVHYAVPPSTQSLVNANIGAFPTPTPAIPTIPKDSAGTKPPVGGVIIQLRYSAKLNADVDLYVRPHRDSDEVSFRRETTSLGRYEASYDFATSEHVKSVSLPAGCDPEKAIAWVNYRQGFGLVSGRVIWLAGTHQREARFSFIASQGADGDSRRDTFRKKSQCWHQINLLDLVTTLSPEQTNAPQQIMQPTSLGTK